MVSYDSFRKRFATFMENNKMKSVPQMLRDAANIYEERNKMYGDNYKTFGSWAFPLTERMVVEDAHDMNRAALFINILNKVGRYAEMFNNGGHRDSLDDLAVYAMMLRELDETLPEEARKRLTGESGEDGGFTIPDAIAGRLGELFAAPPGSYMDANGAIIRPSDETHVKITEGANGDTLNFSMDPELFDSVTKGRAFIGMDPQKGLRIFVKGEQDGTFITLLEEKRQEPPYDPNNPLQINESGFRADQSEDRAPEELSEAPRCMCGHLRGAHRYGITEGEQRIVNTLNHDSQIQAIKDLSKHHECADGGCGCLAFKEVDKAEMGLR